MGHPGGRQTLASPTSPTVTPPRSSAGLQVERTLPLVLRLRVAGPICLVLAGLALLVARAPAYDVWSWLIWGREAAHLDLDTTFGPQFKPLPVIVTTLSAPFGDAAVPIWMFIAYTAGLLGVVGAARVAWRSSGPWAAALTALAVLTSTQFTFYLLPQGMSEPMLMAFAFWAIDQHLAGRPRLAYVLACLAGLLRPETWPFVIAYGLWLRRAGRARPQLLLGLALLMPAAWFLPEWWGSGNPFRTGGGSATPGGAVTQKHPGLAVLQGTFEGLPGIVWGLALAGVVVALLLRDRLLLFVAGLGASWLVVIAVLAEAGKSSGVTRYLIITQGGACILAGACVVQLVRWARVQAVRLGLGRARTAAVALPVLVIAGLAVPSAVSFGHNAETGWEMTRYQQGAYLATARAVKQAGGPALANRCTPYVWSVFLREPELVWRLHTHLTYGRSNWTDDLDPSAKLGPFVRVTGEQSGSFINRPFAGIAYTVAGTAKADGVTAQVLTAC
jgi:hypothetical protein